MKTMTFVLLFVFILSACAPAMPPTATPVPPTATVPPPTATVPPLPTPTLPPPTATIPPPQTPTAPLTAQLAAELQKWSSTGGFSGAALIAQNGQVLLSQGYGFADRAKKIPNTAQTRFRLPFITEQFTVMAILILQTQGKLKVTDGICKYLANCPAAWQSVTLRQLMTHTSGLHDFRSLPDYAKFRATPSSPVQTIARFKDLPLDFRPGETWGYSSSGYILLGYLIEQVSGQPYEAFLKQYIFEPLGLRDTGYDFNSNNVAIGYPDGSSIKPSAAVDASLIFSEGGLYSTVEDLYRWDQALTTDQLVPRAVANEMFTAQAPLPGNGPDLPSTGYGWAIGQKYGQPYNIYWDTEEGASVISTRYPAQQVVIILLSNQENSEVTLIADNLAKMIFGVQ